jgi:hypothetical protein
MSANKTVMVAGAAQGNARKVSTLARLCFRIGPSLVQGNGSFLQLMVIHVDDGHYDGNRDVVIIVVD